MSYLLKPKTLPILINFLDKFELTFNTFKFSVMDPMPSSSTGCKTENLSDGESNDFENSTRSRSSLKKSEGKPSLPGK